MTLRTDHYTEVERKAQQVTGTESTADKIKNTVTEKLDHGANSATTSSQKGAGQQAMDSVTNAKRDAEPSLLDKAKSAVGMDHNNKV